MSNLEEEEEGGEGGIRGQKGRLDEIMQFDEGIIPERGMEIEREVSGGKTGQTVEESMLVI